MDTRRTPEETCSIEKHWAEVASARLSEAHEHDLFAYNVISISNEDYDKADAILRSAYREIRSLVAASEPAQEVALVQVQLLRLAIVPTPGSIEGKH